MSIQPADLIEPIGEITGEMFPGDLGGALEERLQSYIDDGTTRTVNAGVQAAEPRYSQAIAAWAYHRAYGAIYRRLSVVPEAVSLTDEGSSTRSKDQAERFNRLSIAAKESFDKLVAVKTTPVENLIPPTVSVPVDVQWW